MTLLPDVPHDMQASIFSAGSHAWKQKGLWQEWCMAYSHSHLCGCCRPASGLTVRGVSERGPAINQGPTNGLTVRGVSERGPVINQGPHQIQK